MDTELKEAFLNTIYQAKVNNHNQVINLTAPNEWLSNLSTDDSTGWCFITAWNPLPDILDSKENNRRNLLLLNYLKQEGYRYYEGQGTSEDGKWSEKSFLIVGISSEMAIELGATCGQVAIIVGESGSVGSLYSYDENPPSRPATNLFKMD